MSGHRLWPLSGHKLWPFPFGKCESPRVISASATGASRPPATTTSSYPPDPQTRRGVVRATPSRLTTKASNVHPQLAFQRSFATPPAAQPITASARTPLAKPTRSPNSAQLLSTPPQPQQLMRTCPRRSADHGDLRNQCKRALVDAMAIRTRNTCKTLCPT